MNEEQRRRYAEAMTHRPFVREPTIDAVINGVKQWPLDAAVMAADIADVPYGALRAIATRLGQRGKQLDRVLPPMGVLGAMARRGLTQPTPRAQTEMTEPPPIAEDIARFANPANFVALGKSLPALSALAGVVKPKGGNWILGDVEKMLRKLKNSPEKLPPGHVVERTGNRILQRDQDGNISQEWESANPDFDPYTLAPPEQAINDWISGPLTKYVKTRMASPEDEVRKLAEQGVLHFEPGPQPGAAWVPGRTEVGQSELAKLWERAADQVPRGASYKDHIPLIDDSSWKGDHSRTAEFLRKAGGQYAVDNPTAEAYAVNRGRTTADLGFDHLVDELSNALNPESGVPRHLQLTPEAVKNMSMEKAVRRVADINEWRATQKAEANRQIAEKASLVREYTENNPKGLRWVELRKPDNAALTDDQLREAMEARGMSSEEIAATFKDPNARAQVEAMAFEDVGPLAEQLKYEGDVMGHCVGGYCDDVLSGNTRIFSLRDAKGEPHVTVEVIPPAKDPSGNSFTRWANDNPNEYEKLLAQNGGDVVKTSAEWRELYAPELLPLIKQIKGKQNRAPNAEYLPFVQDFVRRPPIEGTTAWGHVDDLENSGLIDVDELRNGYSLGVSDADYQRLINAGLKDWPDTLSGMRYGTVDDIISALAPVKKASGGSIHTPPKEDAAAEAKREPLRPDFNAMTPATYFNLLLSAL